MLTLFYLPQTPANPTSVSLSLREHFLQLQWYTGDCTPTGTGSYTGSVGDQGWTDMKYPFAWDVEVPAGAQISLWWGRCNKHLHCPDVGSYHWDASIPLPLPVSPDYWIDNKSKIGTLHGYAKLYHGNRMLATINGNVTQNWDTRTVTDLGAVAEPETDTTDALAAAVRSPSRKRGRDDDTASAGSYVGANALTQGKRAKCGDDFHDLDAHNFERVVANQSLAICTAMNGASAIPQPWLLSRKGGAVALERVVFRSCGHEVRAPELLLLLYNRSSLPCRAVGWQLQLQFLHSTSVYDLPEFAVSAASNVCLLVAEPEKKSASSNVEPWVEGAAHGLELPVSLVEALGYALTTPVVAVSLQLPPQQPPATSLVMLTLLNASGQAICMLDGSRVEHLCAHGGGGGVSGMDGGKSALFALDSCSIM